MTDDLAQLGLVLLGQVLHANVGADPSLGQDLVGAGAPNAVDIGQADLYPLIFPRHRRVELLKTRARRVGNHARQRRFARSGRSVKNQRSELIRLDRPVQKLYCF